MRIEGRYTKDSNFTTVFCNNTMYTIARGGDWGSISVGDRSASGPILTQADYDRFESEADNFGIFLLISKRKQVI